MSRMHGHNNVRAATSTTARSLGESDNLCKAAVSPRVLSERGVEDVLLGPNLGRPCFVGAYVQSKGV